MGEKDDSDEGDSDDLRARSRGVSRCAVHSRAKLSAHWQRWRREEVRGRRKRGERGDGLLPSLAQRRSVRRCSSRSTSCYGAQAVALRRSRCRPPRPARQARSSSASTLLPSSRPARPRSPTRSPRSTPRAQRAHRPARAPHRCRRPVPHRPCAATHATAPRGSSSRQRRRSTSSTTPGAPYRAT